MDEAGLSEKLLSIPFGFAINLNLLLKKIKSIKNEKVRLRMMAT